ncbi:hypothetical protein [Pelistega europaea]|uniref:Uncharacterized protein n=1 Tax=Pelistega europaea TaxID=106147 RepID=A0A7Y4P5Y2_9BURK|nr:hypothetical protein [Pelistega europaea]NOL49200.1 hypothetical protein [Pelistega europaea]
MMADVSNQFNMNFDCAEPELNDNVVAILKQNEIEQKQGKSVKYASCGEMMDDLQRQVIHNFFG